MQENEFEKRVRQKMEAFMLLPNHEVWTNVAATLKKERRRRPLILWMLTLLLIGGGGAWIFISNMHQGGASKALYPEKSSGTLKESTPAAKSFDNKKDNKDVAAINGRQVKRRSSNIQSKPSTIPKHEVILPTPIKTSAAIYNSSTSKINNKINSNESKHRTYTTSNNSQIKVKAKRQEVVSKAEIAKEVPMHKYYRSPGRLLNDSIQAALVSNSMPVIADTSFISKKIVHYKKPGLKLWNLGFTLYGGLSDNTDGISLVSAKSLNDLYTYNTTGSSSVGSPQPNATAPALAYKSKTSFGAGAYAKLQLAKHIDATLGIDYHYFSAGSFVGSNVAASRIIFDSAQQKQASINQYYGAGQSILFINKYYLIQLPVDLGFRLNKNINKPLVFSLGLSPSILIASKALYLNRGSNIYYEDKNQFKNFMLFGQSSFTFTFINASKYSVGAGPVFQYDFNSFSKPQTGTNQHLIFTGIKTNIILK